MVAVGDSIPSAQLENGNRDNKVDLSKTLKNGVIVGIPAAFSPTCTQGHIPKYVTAAPNKKEHGDIYVVSVNDSCVMDAWQKQLDPDGKSGVTFLADPTGDFTKKLDLYFDATAFFGNWRSKRYALIVKDGKVARAEIEADPSKVTSSSADVILAGEVQGTTDSKTADSAQGTDGKAADSAPAATGGKTADTAPAATSGKAADTAQGTDGKGRRLSKIFGFLKK